MVNYKIQYTTNCSFKKRTDMDRKKGHNTRNFHITEDMSVQIERSYQLFSTANEIIYAEPYHHESPKYQREIEDPKILQLEIKQNAYIKEQESE